jgi:geranylgeranyl diphosphate synthase type II
LNYEATYRGYLGFVEPALEQALVGVFPPLKDAMLYSLSSGGKRIRPVLTLAACDAVGGELRDAVTFAGAIEMIHTYSLIHDDLPSMDNDDFRRGKPSNHKTFGEGMALLAGDALLSLAFEVMAEAVCRNPDNPTYAHALLAIARECGVGGMIAGQARDITSVNQALSANELRLLHTGKTGALMSAACAAGALVGGADEKQRVAMESYGQNLGLAFQVTDDILDATGDSETLGKTPGKDERDGKPTYATMYGISEAELWARRYANLAIEALEPFGKRAEFLRKTAIMAVLRSK